MSQTPSSMAALTNGRAMPLGAIPTLAMDDFERAVLEGVAAGRRVSAYFGAAPRDGLTPLYIVLADDAQNQLFVGRTEVRGDRREAFPARRRPSAIRPPLPRWVLKYTSAGFAKKLWPDEFAVCFSKSP